MMAENQHILKDLRVENVSKDENFIRFARVKEEGSKHGDNKKKKQSNKDEKAKARPPIRQCFTLRGTDSLLDTSQMSEPQFKDELERFLFKNLQAERGQFTTLIS